jgi:hypothetical protein
VICSGGLASHEGETCPLMYESSRRCTNHHADVRIITPVSFMPRCDGETTSPLKQL